MSSLDPALAQSVMELLREINQQDGITVITSLHVLELAKTYGRRVIALRGGRIVHDGPPESLDAGASERIFGRAR
jgi:phosphonate transport system ATP-binding protein